MPLISCAIVSDLPNQSKRHDLPSSQIEAQEIADKMAFIQGKFILSPVKTQAKVLLGNKIKGLDYSDWFIGNKTTAKLKQLAQLRKI